MWASSASSSPKTRPFASKQNVGWVAPVLGPVKLGFCLREHRLRSNYSALALRPEAESFCFCTPTISGETTSCTRKEGSSLFGSQRMNPMARWRSSRTYMATSGISCNRSLFKGRHSCYSRIRDAIGRQEGSSAGICRSKPRAQCAPLWNGEDGAVRIDDEPIGDRGDRQASALLADTQCASLGDERIGCP